MLLFFNRVKGFLPYWAKVERATNILFLI